MPQTLDRGPALEGRCGQLVAVLHRTGEPQTAGQLAGVTGVRPDNVYAALWPAFRAGLVQRQSGPRRGYLYTLTADGRAALGERLAAGAR